MLRERPDWTEIETAGEIRHGQPIDETKKEKVALPKSLVEEGEIVFRARGDSLHDQGIDDGDLLVVELRPRGRAVDRRARDRPHRQAGLHRPLVAEARA